MFCKSCGTALTELEAYFYEHRCEPCEREWHERVSAWRNGEIVEPELDLFYGASSRDPSKSSEEAE